METRLAGMHGVVWILGLTSFAPVPEALAFPSGSAPVAYVSPILDSPIEMPASAPKAFQSTYPELPALPVSEPVAYVSAAPPALIDAEAIEIITPPEGPLHPYCSERVTGTGVCTLESTGPGVSTWRCSPDGSSLTRQCVSGAPPSFSPRCTGTDNPCSLLQSRPQNEWAEYEAQRITCSCVESGWISLDPDGQFCDSDNHCRSAN